MDVPDVPVSRERRVQSLRSIAQGTAARRSILTFTAVSLRRRRRSRTSPPLYAAEPDGEQPAQWVPEAAQPMGRRGDDRLARSCRLRGVARRELCPGAPCSRWRGTTGRSGSRSWRHGCTAACEPATGRPAQHPAHGVARRGRRPARQDWTSNHHDALGRRSLVALVPRCAEPRQGDRHHRRCGLGFGGANRWGMSTIPHLRSTDRRPVRDQGPLRGQPEPDISGYYLQEEPPRRLPIEETRCCS